MAAILFTTGACGAVPRVTYRLPGIATVPLGAAVTDAAVAFGTTFCATLTHLDPLHADWGSCQQYLEARVTEQPPAEDEISQEWRVLIVGGLFSHCFEAKGVYAFEQATAHLWSDHHVPAVLLTVGGVDSPEHNAAQVAAYLQANPGQYIAVGHSKGAVDLMTALQNHQVARDNIRALVSVAGAISGSRLVDYGAAATIAGFRKAVKGSGLGECRIEDRGGIDSMRRANRHEFLRQWTPPRSLASYSIVGVVDEDHVSKPLRTMWKLESNYTRDQDSQMAAEEALIPGARFLGVALGDHWALALPLSDHPDAKIGARVDRNRFPRVALLEAIVRFVDHDLRTTTGARAGSR